MSSRIRADAASTAGEDLRSIRLALVALEQAQRHLAKYFEHTGGRPEPDSADSHHNFAAELGAYSVDDAVDLLRMALK